MRPPLFAEDREFAVGTRYQAGPGWYFGTGHVVEGPVRRAGGKQRPRNQRQNPLPDYRFHNHLPNQGLELYPGAGNRG